MAHCDQGTQGSEFDGGTIWPIQNPTTNDRVFWHSTSSILQMSNESSTACFIDVYWISSKKPMLNYPDIAWNDILVNKEDLDQFPATNSKDNDAVVTPGIAGYPSYLTYGMDPTSDRRFTQMFKVLRKKSIRLAPAACERVNYTIQHDTMFDAAIIQEQVRTGIVMVPHATVAVVLVIRGTPTVIKSGDATIAVSTSAHSIAVANCCRYKFSACPTKSRVDYNRAMPLFTSISTGTDVPMTMGTLLAPVTDQSI
ncbi:hypothetical protein QVD99_000113 [Batrachochytrium dendrobatidis]|nr:hypothetical protein QVD99_000113 [Batrachochytrium dendrobatidis]